MTTFLSQYFSPYKVYAGLSVALAILQQAATIVHAAEPNYVGYKFIGKTLWEEEGALRVVGASVVFSTDHTPARFDTSSGSYVYARAEFDLPELRGAVDDNLHDSKKAISLAGGIIQFQNNDGYVSGGLHGFTPDGGSFSAAFAEQLQTEPTSQVKLANILPKKSVGGLTSYDLGAARPFSQDPTRAFWAQGLVINNESNIQRFTARDVFANTKSLSVDIVNRAELKAEFTPMVKFGDYDIPVSLPELALLFDVDHFNWVQTITEPAEWTVQLANGTSRTTVCGPFLDPVVTPTPLQEPNFYIITNEFGVSAPVDPRMTDHLPFYWDEENRVAATTELALTFSDAPWSASSFNKDALYTGFRTELVGVTDKGESKPTGLYFQWRSNATTAGGGAQLNLAAPYADLLPPVIAGGIVDVQVIRPVPEPPSLLLSVIGLAVVAYAARDRRRFCAFGENPSST